MLKTTPHDQLMTSIRQLEIQRDEELFLLKNQVQETFENFSIKNILFGSHQESTPSGDAAGLRNSLLSLVISQAITYIIKIPAVRKYLHTFQDVSGIVFEESLPNPATQNTVSLRSLILSVLGLVLSKKKKE